MLEFIADVLSLCSPVIKLYYIFSLFAFPNAPTMTFLKVFSTDFFVLLDLICAFLRLLIPVVIIDYFALLPVVGLVVIALVKGLACALLRFDCFGYSKHTSKN